MYCTLFSLDCMFFFPAVWLAIHTIAQFVMLHLKLDSAPSQVVCSWLFVCRQCYNTADGLLVMARYCLHRHIASALTRSRGKSRGHKEVTSRAERKRAQLGSDIVVHV